MENITNNISICPYHNCISIPRIYLLKDSQQIKIICNEHGGCYSQNLEISKYLSENEGLRNKLICSVCQIALRENDNIFYCNTCKKLLCKKCKYNNLFHDHSIIDGNLWNKCRIHNRIYSKYCKTCSTSLCGNCDEKSHKNHIIINISEKNENEKAKLKNILETQEKTFEIVEKITILL